MTHVVGAIAPRRSRAVRASACRKAGTVGPSRSPSRSPSRGLSDGLSHGWLCRLSDGVSSFRSRGLPEGQFHGAAHDGSGTAFRKVFRHLLPRLHHRLPRALSLLVVVCLLLPVSSLDVRSQEGSGLTFPALTGRVVDNANIIDDAREGALDAKLAAHEAETSNQVVVATVPDLQGYDIADYANRLGREWAIGTAENDNGVLLVVAPTERAVRIEVGYGLEGALTDALSRIIIQREILPAFREGDYDVGIDKGVTAMLAAIEGEYSIPPKGRSGGGSSGSGKGVSSTIGKVLPLIFIAMVAVPQLLQRTGFGRAANGAFPAGFAGLMGTLLSNSLLIGLIAAVAVFLFVFFNSGKGGGGGGGRGRRRGGIIVGGGGLGGGGFGGGGFGGGGGSFGGGGASGSW